MILLMAGYILWQTSMVMSAVPAAGHVAAGALMLFGTVADAVLVRAPHHDGDERRPSAMNRLY